ncbi:hypothetical protein FEM48_Zijuj09G0191400 [Ziziphus jujuba var. spinosa]|uniref:CCHC-type domain-containing protein n=1 Tax=Ziziphus jujuba var. spinosa TaxID=714518 RepID=A0A978UUS9_ZIZJJ|nr:hypothetical protein FEM48_Zijuj09G0191400 [Ziziphus jujuba var. spinosa]
MPAPAERVRMPANNRVHSSAALRTHGIWQSAIGYDPSALNKDDDKGYSHLKSSNSGSEPEDENAYASFQGLLALARITGSNADEARGACKRCGRVGHLSFQCRNFLSVKEDIRKKDPEAIQADNLSELDKLKGKSGKIIAERNGKRVRKGRSLKNKVSRDDDDDDDLDSDSAKGKKRGRSTKRRSRKKTNDESDSCDGDRMKRKKQKKGVKEMNL